MKYNKYIININIYNAYIKIELLIIYFNYSIY